MRVTELIEGPAGAAAPAPVGPPAPVAAGRVARVDRVGLVAVLAGAGIVATVLVLADLSRRNGLYGIVEYDDGVHFASALRLTDGLWPYKDFVFVQPPGITVLMSPIAALAHVVGTREGIALARICTALVGGANAVLAGLLVRHRGVLAAGVAGFAVALFPPAYFALHTLMLEPYLTLFALIGANLAFRDGALVSGWRLCWAGAAFGLAASMKLFAAVPIAACALFALWRPRTRLVPFAAGVTAGFAAICLPFFAVAPGAFLRDVVTAQITRRSLVRSALHTRLWSLTGLRGLSSSLPPTLASHVPNIAAVVELTLVCATVGIPATRRGADALERFVLLATLGVVVAILVPAEFYAHYAYFEIAFLGPVLGYAASHCARGLRRVLDPPGLGAPGIGATAPRARRAGAGVLAGLTGLIAVLACSLLARSEATFGAIQTEKPSNPMPYITRYVPKGACAIGDAAILLLLANRFFADAPGCPAMIDATGTWLTVDPTHPPRSGERVDPKLVALWHSWFARADYVVFSRVQPFRVPWTPALEAYFHARFTRVMVPAAIYQRHALGGVRAPVLHAAGPGRPAGPRRALSPA